MPRRTEWSSTTDDGSVIRFELEIDEAWLAKQMAMKLRNNRTGRSVAMNRAVTARLLPVESTGSTGEPTL